MDPIIEYCCFLVIGALCLRQIRQFGPIRNLTDNHAALKKFVECDLCLGSWFLMGLSLLWGLRIEFIVEPSRVLDMVDVFLTGVVSAYVLHIVKLGLREFLL